MTGGCEFSLEFKKSDFIAQEGNVLGHVSSNNGI